MKVEDACVYVLNYNNIVGLMRKWKAFMMSDSRFGQGAFCSGMAKGLRVR